MNRYSIVQGEPVIVRSRVDDQQIWHGTMGAIDEQSSNSSSGNGNYGMVDSVVIQIPLPVPTPFMWIWRHLTD